MPFPALIAAEDKLAAKQKSLRSIFDEAGPDMDMSKVKSLTGDSADKVKAIREMNGALLDGRANVSFADVQRVAKPVLRHRMIRSFEGEADGVSTDDVVAALLAFVPTTEGAIAEARS